MKEQPRILVVDPHPDDESFFWGGTIAKYVEENNALIHALVLTDGEKGKIALTNTEKGIIGYRQPESTAEEEWLAEARKRECLQAAGILGIHTIEFVGLPNLGVNENALPLIRNKIITFNPHIVITFNEAGTFAPSNQDHSWAGIATHYAILSLLDTHTIPSFRRFFTYHLPDAKNLLEKWAEFSLPPEKMTVIDVSQYLETKRQASESHETQRHLMEFFTRQGIIDAKQECFYERIVRGTSAKGTDDLLFNFSEKENISVTLFPEEGVLFSSSSPEYLQEIHVRCETADSWRKSHTIFTFDS